MWPLLAGLASAILPSVISSNTSAGSVRDSNTANSALAQRKMDFQRDMSNTSHQREIQDLKASGLNPILSGMGGGGSSTPQGATAVMQPEMPHSASKLMSIEGRKVAADISLINSAKKLNDSKTKYQNVESDLMQKGIPKNAPWWLRGGTQGVKNVIKKSSSGFFSKRPPPRASRGSRWSKKTFRR